MARSEKRKRGIERAKQKPFERSVRQSKRAKDHVRCWMYQGSSFERLNPEE
jgi:hypothetical protein